MIKLNEKHLNEALDWLVGGSSHEVVENILERVIAQLRNDPGMPYRDWLGWEAYFAKLAAHAAEDLHWLDGAVHRSDAVRAIINHLQGIDQGIDNVEAPSLHADGAR